MFGIIFLDQATKVWIVNKVTFNTYHNPTPIPVIDGFFYIVHIGNRGSAWGILDTYPNVLIVFAIIVLISIFIFRKELMFDNLVMQYAFGFLCGGIIGNLIDRLARGHVVDFLDFHLFADYRWPAFNVADMAICSGVFLYILCSMRTARQSATE